MPRGANGDDSDTLEWLMHPHSLNSLPALAGQTDKDGRCALSPALRSPASILCEDVTELVDHEPDLVILSRGREGRLGVSPETLSLLPARGVPVVREKTDAALATYNRLAAEGRRVAGLFHTTC